MIGLNSSIIACPWLAFDGNPMANGAMIISTPRAPRIQRTLRMTGPTSFAAATQPPAPHPPPNQTTSKGHANGHGRDQGAIRLTRTRQRSSDSKSSAVERRHVVDDLVD